MGLTLAEKIIKEHLVGGEMTPGGQVTVRVDHVLLQDATGTMVWLEFEALGATKVKPEKVVQYVDHNLLQADNKNMDDHLFLRDMCSKFGAVYSMPGNGISHHLHVERFTAPGKLMVGSDSHTPTSGGCAMIAIGVGGLDAAIAMAKGEFTFRMPKIVGVRLTGELPPWSTGKDVILDILRRIDVDGGSGKIVEFFGPGVTSLSVADRCTICNMGAETGATTSLFPSDDVTRSFFAAQKREDDFVEMNADGDATYAEVMDIDLGEIEPLIACPHSPGNVKKVREVAGIEVGQAMIGSSTNSSYASFMRAARMVEARPPTKDAFFHVIPGSRQVLETIERDGGLSPLLRAGARIAEPSCNACIGMGNAPATGIVSVRSFPRNWEGRSGTEDDQVFLASPETAVACAITGEIIDPRDLGIDYPKIEEPDEYVIDDAMFLAPQGTAKVRRGPNIKPLEIRCSLEDSIKAKILLKVGDDISTDHILPAGAHILPLRSNIPEISNFVFHHYDPDFVDRAKENKGGIIVGGENYGQGSSREHAAIAPMHLGVRAVIAKSFARIHRANLINWGILPLEFVDKGDYDKIGQMDEIDLDGFKAALEGDAEKVPAKMKEGEIRLRLNLSRLERDIILKCGKLNFIKEQL